MFAPFASLRQDLRRACRDFDPAGLTGPELTAAIDEFVGIEKLAAGVGLALIETEQMPANNLMLAFGRR